MKKILVLMLIALMFMTLTGCGASDSQESNGENPPVSENNDSGSDEVVEYIDGVYEGESYGYKAQIKVSVEVTDGKISKVEILEQDETESIAGPALEQTPSAIVEKNSTDVEVVSGATLTSEGIINAVKNALENAKK
ncbi:FMN-binding protein [Alkalicella caledoniensis]|uniref:FMN-binding protein n=1 Tax=Alkalicella caledoniensis TaxID=2731377 RepID=A0A7G9W9K3_ALKCA|nr:FMN-binding protein [Alkalicella caledoniensis]QNO15365.1 FMN-binding protein [Alkalicella caledoniensis]